LNKLIYLRMIQLSLLV